VPDFKSPTIRFVLLLQLDFLPETLAFFASNSVCNWTTGSLSSRVGARSGGLAVAGDEMMRHSGPR
jgi:hypothetical protein